MRLIHFIFGCCLATGVNALLNITMAGKLNEFVTLPCRLQLPVPAGVIVRWYSGKDKWLTSGSAVYKHRDRMSIMKPAPNEWNLRIDKLDVSFADIYTCHTDNNNTVSIIELFIESAPKIDEISSTPRKYEVPENNVATMKCIASGTPKPSIQWFRGQDERPIGVSGPILRIRNVERYATDVYTCLAKNRNGEASKKIHLNVTFEPEVDVMSSVVYASQGEAAVMSCVIQGYPVYDEFWTDKKGKRLSSNWKYLVMNEPAGDGIPVKFINLIFRPAVISAHDYGNYTCTARGENKIVEKVIQLKERVSTAKNGEKVIHY